MLFSALLLTGAFSACNDSRNDTTNVDSFSRYVDSVDMATPVYTEDGWTTIDRGYQERQVAVDANVAAMKAEDRARVEASKAKYAALKAKYEAKMKARAEEVAKPDYRIVLRNSLFGEGKVGKDINFGWVTGDNIKDVYQRFVNNVDDHRNDYSREDWDEIKVLYEALDSRKNEVEKNLSTRDNLEIARMKIKFAAIKSVKRPVAKAEENHDAKQ